MPIRVKCHQEEPDDSRAHFQRRCGVREKVTAPTTAWFGVLHQETFFCFWTPTNKGKKMNPLKKINCPRSEITEEAYKEKMHWRQKTCTNIARKIHTVLLFLEI